MIHETQAVEFEIINNASNSLKFVLENDDPITIVMDPKDKEVKKSAQIEIGEEFSITLDNCPVLTLTWESGNALKQPDKESAWIPGDLVDYTYSYQWGIFSIGIKIIENSPGGSPSIGIQIVGTGGFPH